MNLKIKILFAGLILLSTSINAIQERSVNESTTKVLLFKWKSHVDEFRKQKMTQLFTALSDEVPGFEQLEIREIKSDRFEVAFFLTFRSQQAIEGYKNHELHKKIIYLGQNIIDDFLEFEFVLSEK